MWVSLFVVPPIVSARASVCVASVDMVVLMAGSVAGAWFVFVLVCCSPGFTDC